MLVLYNILSLMFLLCITVYGIITQNKIVLSKVFFSKYGRNNIDIWLHGSSIGELMSAKALIEKKLLNIHNFNILITTTSKNGYLQFKDHFIKLSNNLQIEYLPYDNTFLAKRFIHTMNPKLVIWLEQDFYINFFVQLKKKNIPLVLLNARMSDKSFNRFSKFSFFIKFVLKHFVLICSYSNSDKEKYDYFSLMKVKYLGNLKYTNLDNYYDKEIVNKLYSVKKKTVFCALSTHSNEEYEIINSFINSDLLQLTQIILMPRHIDRIKGLIKQLETSFSIQCSLLSEVLEGKSSKDIIVVDKMGLTNNILMVSDIVFVGKSLGGNVGGHNVLEPLSFNKVVIVGNRMDNFIDIVKEAKQQNAILEVTNFIELVKISKTLLNNEELRLEMQQTTKNFISHNNILEDIYNTIKVYL